jgi:pyruvate/2-oxoglutarate dehydrogenase complex dihydrolipoamide dehydrogenase (E3) component
VLLATGRRPDTDDLALDMAGIRVDPRGYFVVDDELRASAPDVSALGDGDGRDAFTHNSHTDFEIVAANLLDDGAIDQSFPHGPRRSPAEMPPPSQR